MKKNQKPIVRKTVATLIGGLMMASIVARVNAAPPIPADVTDVTVWTSTPNEVVTLDTPWIPYNGGVYAGINDLSVTGTANYNGTYYGFCIDPFHYSVSGSTPGYDIVGLDDAPKAVGPYNAGLNQYTATEIEDLWAEYFSPTMTSSNAAGLQDAIWTLVSSNAVAVDGLPSQYGISFSGNTYGMTADLASLATYNGAAANLVALTGPGQDYVIQIPGTNIPLTAPDGGTTVILLVLSLGALALARPVILRRPVYQR